MHVTLFFLKVLNTWADFGKLGFFGGVPPPPPPHVNIIITHVDVIYLACRRSNCPLVTYPC